MPKNAVLYKDLWIAPGTALFAVLEKKDSKLVEALYREQTAKYRASMQFGWV